MPEKKIALSVDIKSVKRIELDRTAEILGNVLFELGPGEIIAIVGRNGVGKTTLLNSILNLPDSNYSVEGSICWKGSDLLNSVNDADHFRKHIAKYIFQDAADCFDPLKKLSYYFGSETNYDELNDYLDYFLLPASNIILNKYPGELSVGMAQRLSIIWGLLLKPEILLLDEPSSALDAPIINLLSHKLKEWCIVNDSCIILVTQNIEFARNTATDTFKLTKEGLIKYKEGIQT